MPAMSLSATRRELLATAVAAGAVGMLPGTPRAATTEADAIRPFTVTFPEEEPINLRRRIAGTRWPEREQVTGDSQGVQFDTVQKLARYWGTEYDWRGVEARLNALPDLIARIAASACVLVAGLGQYDVNWPDWCAEYMLAEQTGRPLPS